MQVNATSLNKTIATIELVINAIGNILNNIKKTL